MMAVLLCYADNNDVYDKDGAFDGLRWWQAASGVDAEAEAEAALAMSVAASGADGWNEHHIRHPERSVLDTVPFLNRGRVPQFLGGMYAYSSTAPWTSRPPCGEVTEHKSFFPHRNAQNRTLDNTWR